MKSWGRIALLAACLGCATAAGKDDAGNLLQDGGPDAGPDAGPDEDAGPTYSLKGQVTHLDGTPWGRASVGLCSAIACLTPIFSSGTGTFEADGLSPDDYVVNVDGDPSDGGSWSPVYFDLRLESNLALSSPVIMPETGHGTVLVDDGGAQEVQVDGSLSLTVDPAALTWPSGDASPISGIEIPSGKWPGSYAVDLPDGGGRTILGVWALNPFQAASSTPIAVAIHNSFALQPGSRARLYGIDVNTGMPSAPVELQVSGDGGVLATLPGQGLSELTWLILVSEN